MAALKFSIPDDFLKVLEVMASQHEMPGGGQLTPDAVARQMVLEGLQGLDPSLTLPSGEMIMTHAEISIEDFRALKTIDQDKIPGIQSVADAIRLAVHEFTIKYK